MAARESAEPEPAHIEGEHPAPGRHALHLACDREPYIVVQNRGEARELSHHIERPVGKGQLRRTADAQLEPRVTLSALHDPVHHQIDAAALNRAVLVQPVEEVPATTPDVQNT